MPFNKPHMEFVELDMAQGWETPHGYPAGIKQKILASDIDEARKTGSRTRLLKFDAGTYTTAPFVHDHWEEDDLVSGDLMSPDLALVGGGHRVHHRTLIRARENFHPEMMESVEDL